MERSVTPLPLAQAARQRYLRYALSVIKSRALPDVRDGLKPVQRRILYTMFHNLHLTPEARYRKCAAIVGEVMGKYHPHGDSAIYEAMVRMAQPFSLLHPLVDGQGNFGSIDGDNAAAMRYTEAKLRPIAVELLAELKQKTVEMRPTYDGQHFEPIVVPAQFPNLLVNGSEGIAVGMATSIPPHNLRETIDACLLLLADADTPIAQLCKKVKGPDLPTGGEIVTPVGELRQMYELGSGTVRVRGTWEAEQKGRKHYVIVNSVPYGVNKAKVVESIGELIAAKKVPQLTDVRDESTDVVRVVLELRQAGDENAAMAFLFKHTRLEELLHVNMTALVPTDNPDAAAPEKLDLKRMLQHWLHFRVETVRRRTEFELGQLRERIHILEGLAKIFDCLDEAIRIIRASEGRRDAQEKLMLRFDLDDVQADAILALTLYKLARLEILIIQEELEEKRAAAELLSGILASREKLRDLVRSELEGIRKQYGEPRRTLVGTEAAPMAYSEEAYLVEEDAVVVVTRDGWVKRQGTITGVEKVRVREGDSIGWALRTTTRHTLTVFTSQGSAYTLRVETLPATTGYGEPIQKFFAFADGERVVGVLSHDPRNLPAAPAQAALPLGDDPPPPYFIAVSQHGKVVRLPIALVADVSNRNGRAVMKLDADGDLVVAAYPSTGDEQVCLASVQGNVLTFPANEIPVLRGAGKGVMAMKLRPDDRVLAYELHTDKATGPLVLTQLGREETVNSRRFAGARADRGAQLFRRGYFALWKRPPELLLGKPNPDGEA
jgi:DNA gyrase subunit A